MLPSLLVITGPTAVGKSEVAIQLARHLNTEIISADSRQFYKELNIGTAKPDDVQLSVPHHFISHISVRDYYSAGRFETNALKTIRVLLKQHKCAIMTGGSGLYIQAVCSGIDKLPPVDEKIRSKLLNQLDNEGLGSLQDELKKRDPTYFQTGDTANPRRVIRALEVCMQSDKPYSAFLHGTGKKRPFRIIRIVLTLPREELYRRINERVDAMMKNGLLEEVEKLKPFRSLNALQTVGYRELFEYLDGKTALEEAIALIKRNTRRYARMQMSWLRRDDDVPAFHPDASDAIIQYLEGKMTEKMQA
ncbi:MAG: tRNA (adenosine(37)-N6)-dimethylallyltransferase MiaA [Flavobacteriales bacterium]